MKYDKVFGTVIAVLCVVLLLMFIHLLTMLGEPQAVWLYELLSVPLP